MKHRVPAVAAAILLTAAAHAAAQTTAHFAETVIDPEGAGDCKMLADLDGDGFLDAILAGRPGEDLAWYAYPSWTRRTIGHATVEFTTDGAVADLDADGDPDIIIPDGQTGQNLHWFRNPRPAGSPAGGPWTRLTIGAGDGWIKDLDPADFDGDGRTDVAARTHGAVFIFFRTLGGGWTRTTIEEGLTGEGMAAGDMDRDGDRDLVLPGFWLENPRPASDPETAPWPRWTIAAGAPSEAKILVADMDGSGDHEVLYSHSEGTGPIRLFDAGDAGPRGPWTPREVVPALSGCHTLLAADADADGDLDLIIGQMHTAPPSELSVVYNDGGAVLWRRVPFATGGIHNGVAGDIEGDGDTDLFGANWTGNPPARVWLNTPQSPPADFDDNGVVDHLDLSEFFRWWMDAPRLPGAGGDGPILGGPGGDGGLRIDFDGSGTVDTADASAFMRAWIIAVSGG